MMQPTYSISLFVAAPTEHADELTPLLNVLKSPFRRDGMLEDDPADIGDTPESLPRRPTLSEGFVQEPHQVRSTMESNNAPRALEHQSTAAPTGVSIDGSGPPEDNRPFAVPAEDAIQEPGNISSVAPISTLSPSLDMGVEVNTTDPEGNQERVEDAGTAPTVRSPYTGRKYSCSRKHALMDEKASTARDWEETDVATWWKPDG